MTVFTGWVSSVFSSLTKEEFLRHLSDFTKLRYSNYSILYFAFHGRSNRIVLGKEEILLSELADVLEGKLSGKIVHFGSCLTLKTTDSNLLDFVVRTKCLALSGFIESIEFNFSTALDLLYFNTLQQYVNIKVAYKTFSKQVKSCIDALGFIVKINC